MSTAKSKRARLDTAGIIRAGLEVAAEFPSPTFSATKLGSKLGVDPSAIYRHFRNKGHLMEALLDQLHLRSVSRVTAPDEQWRERIRQLAEATLTFYSTYPSIAGESMVVTTHGKGELDVMELILAALGVAGLNGDEAVQHYALISSFIMANASGIARSRATSGIAGSSFEPDTNAPWLEGPILASPREHPSVAKYASQLSELRDHDLFFLGIETLLDAAERAASRSTQSE